jgi:acetyl esterase/lipase
MLVQQPPRKTYLSFLTSLAIILTIVSFFLTSWIILPAPNMQLLTLAVGAPEYSPWLLVLNAASLLISFFFIYRRKIKHLACIASLIGLLICGWQLVNILPTQRQMATAMEKGLGANYLEKVPDNVKAKMRQHPFILADNFRGIHLSRKIRKKNIRFANPVGVPLSIEISQPPQTGKYPAIVVIYGGAWQSGSPAANPQFNQYMAERGYTVFAIDYRHAPQHHFPAQLDDVRTALSFIQQHAPEYEADPERIALLGRSSGGHLAMLAAYQLSSPPIRAVVSYYGPVNLTKAYNSPPFPDPINSRAVLEKFMGGSPQVLPKQYQIASPINYVNRPLPPTLLIYGSRDHLVEAKYGREMYEKLQDKGSTAVFLEIPWAEHAFDIIFNGVSNQLALYYTERFLAWALL